jgi:hypothetical protein
MESLGKGGRRGEEEGRAKMGLMGVMGGWRGCGEEGEGEEGKGGGGESNGFEVGGRRPRPVGGRDGGGCARLSAAIGAA